MRQALLVLSLCLALAARAFAADGDECTAAPCSPSSGTRMWFLCDSQHESGTDTDCGPIVINSEHSSYCTVDLVTVQAACTIPTMTIDESRGLSGASLVWTTLGTLTGPTSPDVSQIDPGRPIGPALRATFVDITDADCTDVDVVVTCFK